MPGRFRRWLRERSVPSANQRTRAGTDQARTETIEPGPVSQRGIAMERRLAIVLAKLLGSFSVLWIINSNVVALDQPVMMGERSTSSSSAA